MKNYQLSSPFVEDTASCLPNIHFPFFYHVWYLKFCSWMQHTHGKLICQSPLCLRVAIKYSSGQWDIRGSLLGFLEDFCIPNIGGHLPCHVLLYFFLTWTWSWGWNSHFVTCDGHKEKKLRARKSEEKMKKSIINSIIDPPYQL